MRLNHKRYETRFLPMVLLMWVGASALVADGQDTLTESVTFKSNWDGSRVWIGPEYWANPLQDWNVDDGVVTGKSSANRTLHCLTHQVVSGDGVFEMSVKVRFDGEFQNPNSAARSIGGFRLGIQGKLEDYRHVLVHATRWIDAGIRGDGRLTLDGQTSSEGLNVGEWITLKLQVEVAGETARVALNAESAEGTAARVEMAVASNKVRGNVALLSHGSRNNLSGQGNANAWKFDDWSMAGNVVHQDANQRFGPILWTQYTLSRNVLKLTALLAPVEQNRSEVHFEIERDGEWERISSTGIDPHSRTSTFRVDNWDDREEQSYRVVYEWGGKEHQWHGVIKRNPSDAESLSVGVFSCDHGYVFPNSRIVRNVKLQNPDLVFFAGDQIYEGYGNFGITREPFEIASLDYLRKYWMFGWSWRDVLKDRPSVIIPDDHDVFQGNIWGHGGRRIPCLEGKPTGNDWARGGYAMDPEWINAVQRTQTAHLPDAYDSTPAEQGIDVYYTDMNYGGVSFAILEDRKFKSGPAAVFENLAALRRNGGPADLDSREAELLGERQESFLKNWMDEESADSGFKVVLSQSIFCKVTTHTGRDLRPSRIDFDTNAWPKNKRDSALRILSSGDNNNRQARVVMLHGDQHLGALVHQGIDDWEDGPIALMVPGTANGFPRAWWPGSVGENHKDGDPVWTGRYLDGLGNRMTVLAAANPEKGSNEIKQDSVDPEELGHLKGSGHGIVRFHHETGEVTFEMWRLQFDAADPSPADQFEGFPQTIQIRPNN